MRMTEFATRRIRRASQQTGAVLQTPFV